MKNIKPLHIVGLGGAGCNMLEYFFKQRFDASYTCVTSSARPNWPASFGFHAFVSPKRSDIQQLSDMDVPFVLPETIKNIFVKEEKYVLLAGLGSYCGTRFAEHLCAYLHAQHIGFQCICTMPFDFEGDSRKQVAQKAVETLGKYPDFKSISLEEWKRKFGNLSLSDFLERMDKEVFESLFCRYSDDHSVAPRPTFCLK